MYRWWWCFLFHICMSVYKPTNRHAKGSDAELRLSLVSCLSSKRSARYTRGQIRAGCCLPQRYVRGAASKWIWWSDETVAPLYEMDFWPSAVPNGQGTVKRVHRWHIDGYGHGRNLAADLATCWTLVAIRPQPLGLRVVKVPIGGLRAPRPDSLNVIRITLGWHLDRRRAASWEC